MTVNFSLENEPTRFYFDETNMKAGWVDLRACPKDYFDEIEKQTVHRKKKFKRGTYVEDIVTNREKQSELLWDYTIVEWDGVLVNGVVQKCTKENKIKLMNKSPQFMTFYASCIEQLEDVTIDSEDKAKNLGKQSSDLSTSSTATAAKISKQDSEKR